MVQPSKAERFMSLLVDIITIFIIVVLSINYARPDVVAFITILITLAYFPLIHGLFSRSIGDMVFNLKILDQRGNKIGFRLALKRLLCVFKYYIFSLLLCNLLLLLYIFLSGTVKDIRDVLVDYENESETYLVKVK